MIETLWIWIETHPGLTATLAVASLLTFIGSLVLLPVLAARLPEDYFVDPQRHRSRLRQLHPAVYVVVIVLKNLVGWVLVVAGIVMLVLPGQGLLTILVGLVLSDFPGKFALERRLAGRRNVLAAINWLRQRSGRPPLQSPKQPDGRACVDSADV